ncbi:MAG TPA: polysaccharide deacetylase family protein [Actinocrinis sp.]|uniref:polysaccharide deacetylase family protein n=1 Tax=Actinocrinis sp. TaxID=1920516 RepID=UPI002DDCFBCA|nr:polysaccharide deacetylase family protein [Actinocrinis sp.]HEV3173720.1 polysaccharide deacetylase family protein [Actinocrinis sp.]
MTVRDERGADAWSRRATLRAVFGACALASAAGGCSSGGGGDPHSTTAGKAGALGTAALPASPGATSAAVAAPAPAEIDQALTVRDAVALTFHGDGPPAMATALLAEAERAGARLTVLAVGRWLGANPQMAKRIMDGGHELGNHTERHIDIDALSPDAAYAEVENCAARLQRLTGSRGRWFRPSQTQHANSIVLAAAVRAGYPTVLAYDLDSLDYTDPGASVVVHNVLSAVRGGDVVSMHLGHQGTIQALPEILDGLRTRGLRAVTASELFPAPITASEVADR